MEANPFVIELLHFLSNKLEEPITIDVMGSFLVALDSCLELVEGIVACTPHKLLVLKKDPTTRFSVCTQFPLMY